MSQRINRAHVQHYQRWHWGAPAERVLEWPDPIYPAHMIEIGRLAELHYVDLNHRAHVFEVPAADLNNNAVVFDPEHSGERIYLLLSARQLQAARRFWNPQAPSVPLAKLAAQGGGRHATGRAAYDYPNVRVQPVGVLTHIKYRTWKKGDDDAVKGSFYIHEMGEEGGVPPILAVDARGRLWLAGGSYTCPTPGITR